MRFGTWNVRSLYRAGALGLVTSELDRCRMDLVGVQEDQIDVANRFSALEGLEISSVDDTWVKIRDSIKDSAKEKVGILETIRNKPWFDEECSELANKRKQTKLLWP